MHRYFCRYLIANLGNLGESQTYVPQGKSSPAARPIARWFSHIAIDIQELSGPEQAFDASREGRTYSKTKFNPAVCPIARWSYHIAIRIRELLRPEQGVDASRGAQA